jgi:hypothetical protein
VYRSDPDGGPDVNETVQVNQEGNSMTRQRLAELIRRTLAELQLGGYILATLDVGEHAGVVCYIVTVSPSRAAHHIYLDLYEYDENRAVEEIKRQLAADDSGRPIRRRPHDVMRDVR